MPIGEEKQLEGVVDLINMTSVLNKGENGEIVEVGEVPAGMLEEAEAKRQEIIETLADVDEEIEELFLMEEEVDAETMAAAIRRATIGLKFVPVLMGSAFKNRGVQEVLDAVMDYLPSPPEIQNKALDLKKDEALVDLSPDPDAPLVALAFKLEEGQFGQLTYMRVYQVSRCRQRSPALRSTASKQDPCEHTPRPHTPFVVQNRAEPAIAPRGLLQRSMTNIFLHFDERMSDFRNGGRSVPLARGRTPR
jgi:hypothetical protein